MVEVVVEVVVVVVVVVILVVGAVGGGVKLVGLLVIRATMIGSNVGLTVGRVPITVGRNVGGGSNILGKLN